MRDTDYETGDEDESLGSLLLVSYHPAEADREYERSRRTQAYAD